MARSRSTEDGTRSIAAELTGLVEGQTYHYRLVGITQTGLTYGNDVSFVAGAPN
jgi:hypothetical protein